MAEPVTAHRTPYRTDHGKATLVFYNRPTPCGGSCRFCILQPGFTKSTVRNDDTLLAHDCGWDPTCQIDKRFREYGLRRGLGHKYGLAVKGDSFTNHEPAYQREFFKGLYDYLNATPSGDFDEARERQADAPDRCVWVQVETRPDQITEEWCDILAQLGANTVELGVQSLDDDVLHVNRRGHGTDAVHRATRLLRERGFEVGYHMMVGLPGSTDELDYEVLTQRLWEPRYSPDCMKIYPCILLRDHRLQRPLTRIAKTGRWNPITDERYRNLLDAALPRMPSTVHINRIQRLMPPGDVDLGPSRLIDRGDFTGVSRCLWQRSPARAASPLGDLAGYRVSSSPHGTGFCVEATVRDGRVVLGYGRLTVLDRIGLIRDVRVLGDMVPVDSGISAGPQHLGIGKAMVREMERLAREQSCERLRVRPSVGTVRYFERLGFRSGSGYYLDKPLGPVPGPGIGTT